MNRKYLMALMGLGLVIAFVSGYGIAQLTVTKELPSSASLITDVNISVYENKDTEIEITSVDWGNILPSETKSDFLWIENNANIPLRIELTTKDWSIDATELEHFTFTYEHGGICWDDAVIGTYPILNPHKRGGIKISLVADAYAIACSFSFMIVITGTTVSP